MQIDFLYSKIRLAFYYDFWLQETSIQVKVMFKKEDILLTNIMLGISTGILNVITTMLVVNQIDK